MARRRMMNGDQEQTTLLGGGDSQGAAVIPEPSDDVNRLAEVGSSVEAAASTRRKQSAPAELADAQGKKYREIRDDVSPAEGVVVASVETVSVTWGEEQFSPLQFHSFRVGPFSATTAIRQDESRRDAFARLAEELRAHAEAEKVRKHESYMKSVASMKR